MNFTDALTHMLQDRPCRRRVWGFPEQRLTIRNGEWWWLYSDTYGSHPTIIEQSVMEGFAHATDWELYSTRRPLLKHKDQFRIKGSNHVWTEVQDVDEMGFRRWRMSGGEVVLQLWSEFYPNLYEYRRPNPVPFIEVPWSE